METHEHSHHEHSHHDHHHEAAPDHDHSAAMASPAAAKTFLRKFFTVTALLIPLTGFSMLGMKLFGYEDFPLRRFIEFGIATLIFTQGLIFFEHARHEIRASKFGMMTLVSLAVGAGFLFSVASTFLPRLIDTEFYLEISTLIWVLLFGHFLEAKSSSAAGDALQEVAKLLPKVAHLISAGETKDVDITSLKTGDVVLVKAGEKVPADGLIVKGSSHFNEAHITGESKPIEKKESDRVIAGAIAEDGSVEIALDKVGENSTIGQIQKLIASAQRTKPSAQRLADKAASILTFVALIVAAATLVIWSLVVGESFVFGLTLAITVLVIACPHALGLAIPTVTTIATKKAVENGIFLKDLSKLEVIKNVGFVVFDKTGTLTEGSFGVTHVLPLAGTDKKDLLSVAGAIESKSSHVIAAAIVEFVQKENIDIDSVENVKNLAGKGIEGTIAGHAYSVGNLALMTDNNLVTDEVQKAYRELSAQGKTVALVASASQVLGLIGLSDQVKSTAKQVIADLHALDVRVAMITGDNEGVAKPVAAELGIDTYFANVLPEDKYRRVLELQDQGNVVLMVGDGVNDAPALTQANVGVAIGAGTEVAVEAGDVVLTRSNPGDITALIILSRKVYAKMIQNLWWALGYNILAIPAAAGLFMPLGIRLTPQVGAILMAMSSVIVVVNAFTLKSTQLKPQQKPSQ